MRVGIVSAIVSAAENLAETVRKNGWSVAWKASDGEGAVRLCFADLPDIILMDLATPVLDGARACKKITQRSSIPIIAVTASVKGNSNLVYDAIESGASDVVELAVPDDEKSTRRLLGKMERLCAAHEKSGRAENRGEVRTERTGLFGAEKFPMLAIGASTGGPEAVMKILSSLSGDIGAAIAIVQHIEPAFSDGFAKWLSSSSAINVKVAQAGETPLPHTAYVANGSSDLTISPDGKFQYSAPDSKSVYTPNIDRFFSSLADNWSGGVSAFGVNRNVALLLTGMGSDGAKGLLKLKNRGWTSVVQGRKSSAVFGMPKAAENLGAADYVLELDSIAEFVKNVICRDA